ncbi:MAG: nitrilase-related carbon-nitrogen hydrolase [Deltaproteobacteria bacterium]|nr:nitrilase-related carbon-nitrogen hydrolase [Deltaproteobacteria bacterium]
MCPLESQVYVLKACGVLSPDQVPDDFPLKQRTLWNANGGSAIIGPDGEHLSGPVYDEETILYGGIDPQSILKEKWRIDTVGHYSRQDLLKLIFTQESQNHV